MLQKKWFRWVKIILLVYCIIGIALYYAQDKILFRPVAVARDSTYQFAAPYKEVNLLYSATSNMNIIQFQTVDTPAKGVVLYFHGNRNNISWYANNAPRFTKKGYEVWMIDYPGYGKSTGDFTEKMLYEWALQLYKLARARFSPDSIILYGKSLGTGIATQLGAIRDCKYLLLETPYYSFPSIVGVYFPMYPVDRMIHFKIPTWQYLQEVTAPVVIFHGTGDGVIRHSCAERLKPWLKKSDQFVTIGGGSHNDLPTYPVFEQKMDSLLSR